MGDSPIGITRLHRSIRNLRNARNPAQREAHLHFVTERAIELARYRDTLLQRIEDGWAWLNAYEWEDPAVRKEEDQFVAWNAELRQITDALDDAERAISGEVAA